MDDTDEQLPPSSPFMEPQTKKMKKFVSMESPEFLKLQPSISQHNETAFIFATEEQQGIFESLITIERDPFIITNEQMHEQIATGLREQHSMISNEELDCAWWSYQSVVFEINKILCQSEDEAVASITTSLNSLKRHRIHTPYDLFLISQKSLPPNAWESTFMRMVNHLLDYQFKFRKNIIFRTQEVVQPVERSKVEGTKLETKLCSVSFAQLENAMGASSLVFLKCEGQRAENLKHKDHFELTTMDGIATFTTFIEIMCEHVYECKQQLAKEVKGEKVSSSSTLPIRSKPLSLEGTLKSMNMGFGRNRPVYNPIEDVFDSIDEGVTSLVETLSPLFKVNVEVQHTSVPNDCISVFAFKKGDPFVWIKSLREPSCFVGVFYWGDENFFFKAYACPLSVKSNQERLLRKVLNDHRSDDPKSRRELKKEGSNNNFQPQNQSASSLDVFNKFAENPMNEAACAVELEQILSLSNFKFSPESMRCERSCVGFYGHALSRFHNTSVFVKITAFREENEKVMKKMVHLQISKSIYTFPNVVRIYDFQQIQSNEKLVRVVYNLMKQHNSGEYELKKLVRSTQPISITIQEQLMSLDDVMNKNSIREWVGKNSKLFFMNLVKQCFDILFQLDALNTDISLGNLMIRFDQDGWKRAVNKEEKMACFILVVIDFNSSLLLRERDVNSIQSSENMYREVILDQSVDYVYKYPYSDPSFEMKEVDIYSMAVVIVNYLYHITYGKSFKSKVKEHLESCEQYRIEMIDFLIELNHLLDPDCVKLVELLKYMLGTTEERPSLENIKATLQKMEFLGFNNFETP
ncbi:hypothetical protein C9374_012325 [Naegleria lovaniensis]|uniref:Protein kinase domain-containing protein n=1 Tax=Naegleria lovaniensis TaxID=51637 RepID=A0AA88KHU6_NAELO|nr:uncharacterized protein C9374_012325 [Naegleria lovaniensis]KAG2373222.1 hypothetical protein C9374_012325 [Naegleria lovaniensis]